MPQRAATSGVIRSMIGLGLANLGGGGSAVRIEPCGKINLQRLLPIGHLLDSG